MYDAVGLISWSVTGVQRYGSDLSVSAFLCRCNNDKCDPDTGECMDGKMCIDGQPYNKGVGWRGDSCQTGQYYRADLYIYIYIHADHYT